MKYIAPSLLIGYAVFTVFAPQITIAHSLILFSLAGIFAYNQFLLASEQPSLNDEIAKLKSELEQQIQKQKEHSDAKLASIEGEVTKISLSVVRTSSSSSSTKPAPEKKAYTF
jgi:hypothetical protein